LGKSIFGFGEHPGKKGGEKTPANPTDKGKAGSKRHLLMVDRGGIPLCVMLTAANTDDSKWYSRRRRRSWWMP
jgi:hypothetical protein